VGGNDGLVMWSDADLTQADPYALACEVSVLPGERVRVSMQYVAPELLDEDPPEPPEANAVDRGLDETVKWWRRWASRVAFEGRQAPQALRSAMVLKTLQHAPTGAIAAAATTSLPEALGGSRNWDYRFSWIRDSAYAVRSLADLGFDAEADGFRRFVERTSAGSADELQVLYGLGGERRIGEEALDLDGYRGSRPVRVGNGAQRQFQLDMYGHVLDLAWRWHERGDSPDDDFWRFLSELVECAARRWQEPDRGFWEVRGAPKHFVHSKVMCWAALDRGIRLARECGRRAPERRWAKLRTTIRSEIETRGYDARRGIFVRSYGSRQVDASLLLLPTVGFVESDDPRMIRTTDAIVHDLARDGLLARYRAADGLGGHEGAFLACTFWLSEILARQHRWDEAREAFDRAMSTANDLGLFSEEWDPARAEMLGNFPQGLTHLSHIAAAVALAGQPDG
jgi:GH15 family glucan-1,4-alpha-glucosidase